MKKYNDCMEVREEFSAYLDGELSAEDRAPIEAHLAVCAECLREMDLLKRVDDSYRALNPVSAPADFEDRVRDAVRTGRVSTAAGRAPVPRWTGPLVAMASAAAVLIVGVLVLESRQAAGPEIQMASVPVELEMTAEDVQLMKSAPAASGVAAADRAPAAGPSAEKSAWDDFARPPARDADANRAQFAQAPAPAAATPQPVLGGREDSGAALAEGIEGADAQGRARAEVIGTPPSARDEELPLRLFDTANGASAAGPRAPAQAGEVVSRETLRSFRVLPGPLWVEEGYDHQPTTPLARSSMELRELMRKFPAADWNQILERSARQVFQMGDAWYDLEAPPESP